MFKTLIKVLTVAAKTHVKEILVVSLFEICFCFHSKDCFSGLFLFHVDSRGRYRWAAKMSNNKQNDGLLCLFQVL